MPDVLWYYARNNEQFGPVSTSELRQLAETGRLTPDDLLWCEGMDAWTTAINLDGLFLEEPAPAKKGSPAPARPVQATVSTSPPRRTAAETFERPGSGLASVLRAVQALLWGICVLVVLAGIAQVTRDRVDNADAYEQAASASVYAMYFIGSYVLARCGEKSSRILLEIAGYYTPDRR